MNWQVRTQKTWKFHRNWVTKDYLLFGNYIWHLKHSPIWFACWEVVWRVPCKIFPVKSTQIFSGCLPDFFLIYKYDTQLFSGCLPEKDLGRFYCTDFTGYPSNQFSGGCRLNGPMLAHKYFFRCISRWLKTKCEILNLFVLTFVNAIQFNSFFQDE